MTEYQELLQKAKCSSATQEDLNELGKWFEDCGFQYWNGEAYYADDGDWLYPIYRRINDDDFDIIGYTWSQSESIESLG